MKKAFTLIEIIIVMALILILTTAAITGTSKILAGLRFNNTFNKLIGMLQNARNLAMAGKGDESFYQFRVETQHPPYLTWVFSPNKGPLETFSIDPSMNTYELVVTDLTSGLPCPAITDINFAAHTGKMSINCPGIPDEDEAKLVEFRLTLKATAQEKIFLLHRAAGIPQVR